MRKTVLLAFGFLLLTVECIAQSETKLPTTIPELNKTELNGIRAYNAMLDKQRFPLETLRPDTSAIHIPPPTLSLFSNNNQSGIFPVANRTFTYLESERQVYTGLADYHLVHIALGRRIGEKLSVTGGLLALKQFSYYSLSGIGRLGFKLNVNFLLNDKWTFNAWGQYLSSYSSSFPQVPVMLLPQTGTGASITFKPVENVQIGVVTQYLFDSQSKKWSYESNGIVQLNF